MTSQDTSLLLNKLTARERQIAECYAQGQTYKEAAKALNVSPSTVRNHITAIYRKLEIGNKVELIQLFHSDATTSRSEDLGSSLVSEPSTVTEERRQVTVLVAKLNALPDLELDELHQFIQSYHQYVARIIQKFQGHIARYDSAAVVIYFGYPEAHEDDAERAARSGLQLIDQISILHKNNITPTISIGIDSGTVVFSTAPDGLPLLFGTVSQRAQQLVDRALPNTLLVSESSRILLGEGFYFEQTNYPERNYRINSVKTSVRFESRPPKLTQLVGRKAELSLLLDRWDLAQHQEGQFVLLSGEAGIGKSRVVHTFLESVSDQKHQLQHNQCSPFYTQSALYPFIYELTQELAAISSNDAKLNQLADWASVSNQSTEYSVPLLATLLSVSIEDRYPALQSSAQKQKQDTLILLSEMLLASAGRNPLLIIVEDIHWLDPTSLEFLELLIKQIIHSPVLIIATARPEFNQNWGELAHVSKLTINRLSTDQVLIMVDSISEAQELPSHLREHIASKVDGVPLFVEEVTKAIIESDTDKSNGAATQLGVPATLYDSLLSRLDRLGEAKAIAQIGAVIGREFSRELLQKVAEIDDNKLNDRLEQLVDAGVLYQRAQLSDGSYIFKHALIQDVSYDTLLQNKRQALHAKIVEVLKANHPQVEPELLAQHCEAAGLVDQAIINWQKAGERAAQRSAYIEAEWHFKKGLNVLSTQLESNNKKEKELEFLITLGPMLVSRWFGGPELKKIYNRISILCNEIENKDIKVPALQGLRHFFLVKDEFDNAYFFAKELLRLATETQKRRDFIEAHRGLGSVALFSGDVLGAKQHFEQALKLTNKIEIKHDIRYAGNVIVTCEMYLALALAYLGYLDHALEVGDQSLATAKASNDLSSVADAFYFRTTLFQLYGSDDLTMQEVKKLLAFTDEQKFDGYFKATRVIEHWLLVKKADPSASIAAMLDYLEMRSAVDHKLFGPYDRMLIAEAYKNNNQFHKSLSFIEDTIGIIESSQELVWLAEAYRLKGEILLATPRGALDDVVSSFQKAIQVARSQSAKFWELRAATGLAQLWCDQGKRSEAYELLAPVYNWFTEGFDTADLKDAKALLSELT